MAGATEEEEAVVRSFLSRFVLVPVDERAVEIRRDRRIRLPDAIIWVSAQVHDALLVSRNCKDFPESAPDVRIPYMV